MDNIFDKVNELLGRPKASVEYIYSLPYTDLNLPFGFKWVKNRAGHSAIRYDETVVSVSKYTKEEVTRTSLSKYIFDKQPRDKISILFHDIDPEDKEKIKSFYDNTEIKYKPITISKDSGNCADWVSRGLSHLNILTHHHMLPKGLFIDIFENYPRDKFSIVYYRQELNPAVDIINPIQLFRNWVYSYPEKFADVIVDTTKDPPEVSLNPSPVQPNKLRNILNYKWTLVPSTLLAWFIWKKNIKLFKNFRNYLKTRTKTTLEKINTGEEKLMYLLKIQNKKIFYTLTGSGIFAGLLIQANKDKIKDYLGVQSTEIANTTLESDELKERLVGLTQDPVIQQAVEDLLIKCIQNPRVQTELNQAFLTATRYTVAHQETLKLSEDFMQKMSNDPKIHKEIWNALMASVIPGWWHPK